MCGLNGVFSANSHFNAFQFDTFKWLLNLSTTRGEDSTGVAIRIQDDKSATRNRVVICKSEGLPFVLFNKFPEFFDPLKGDVVKPDRTSEYVTFLMGHNRASTVGATNADNAHPFHHGHIIGTHNGTLSSRAALPSVPDKAGCTDSEQMYYAMSQGWTIQEIVEKTTGAMALAWYNSKEQSYNLFRNNERPLYYVQQYSSTIYYASERWILEQALIRGKNPELVKSIKELEPYKHLKFGLSKKAALTIESFEIAKKTYSTGYQSYTPHNSYFQGQQDKKDTLLPSYANFNQKLDKGGVSHETKNFRQSTGWMQMEFENQDDFEKCANSGCSYCESPLDYADSLIGKVFWLDKTTPLCATCASEWSKNGLSATV